MGSSMFKTKISGFRFYSQAGKELLRDLLDLHAVLVDAVSLQMWSLVTLKVVDEGDVRAGRSLRVYPQTCGAFIKTFNVD